MSMPMDVQEENLLLQQLQECEIYDDEVDDDADTFSEDEFSDAGSYINESVYFS